MQTTSALAANLCNSSISLASQGAAVALFLNNFA
jgi:hypothetical protein